LKKTALMIMILLVAVSAYLFSAEEMNLTIDKAIDLALKNNKNYLISQAEVKQYKYKLRQNLGFLPNVTLEGFKNIDEKLMELEIPPFFPGAEPTTTTIDFTKNYEFTFQVVQPVFAGGKILYSYKNARLDLNIARERHKNTRKEVILQVKKVFFNILVMKELLKAHNEALQLAETNYRNINENYKLGMASKYDLLRAELAAASIKPNILNVQKLLNVSILNLKFMAGIPEKSKIKVLGKLNYSSYPLTLAHLIDQSLVTRSEIRQLEMQMKKTANLLKMAYGQFLPDISLIASYSYRSDFFNFGKNNWDSYYTINLGISFPIFTGLKRSAQIGEIKVMKKILNLNYKQLKETTKLQIHELYMTIQQEYENIQAGLKNIETAEEGVRIAELTYNEGLISILELNTSTNDLTMAKVNFLQAVYNYNIAAAELEKISGIKINGGNE